MLQNSCMLMLMPDRSWFVHFRHLTCHTISFYRPVDVWNGSHNIPGTTTWSEAFTNYWRVEKERKKKKERVPGQASSVSMKMIRELLWTLGSITLSVRPIQNHPSPASVEAPKFLFDMLPFSLDNSRVNGRLLPCGFRRRRGRGFTRQWRGQMLQRREKRWEKKSKRQRHNKVRIYGWHAISTAFWTLPAVSEACQATEVSPQDKMFSGHHLE